MEVMVHLNNRLDHRLDLVRDSPCLDQIKVRVLLCSFQTLIRVAITAHFISQFSIVNCVLYVWHNCNTFSLTKIIYVSIFKAPIDPKDCRAHQMHKHDNQIHNFEHQIHKYDHQMQRCKCNDNSKLTDYQTHQRWPVS